MFFFVIVKTKKERKWLASGVVAGVGVLAGYVVTGTRAAVETGFVTFVVGTAPGNVGVAWTIAANTT